FFFFSRRRRHTRFSRDWSSDVCSSDLGRIAADGTVWLPDDPRDAAALDTATGIVADRLWPERSGAGADRPLPSTSQHLSGSARIGEVVDDAGRVLGVGGLRVADASVFPVLPRCGPYYTVL